ncbi:MAG: AAA family ATPase, partial [Proteobacteria bacterium]
MIVKTSSDILSAFIGETEKNIANAFRQAQKEKSLLFFDEVDLLLSSREKAIRSWEISAINEFLCRIEAFRGVTICATNFADNLDRAAFRRFGLKVHFGFLTGVNALAFFNHSFSDFLADDPLTEVEASKIAKLQCTTPG